MTGDDTLYRQGLALVHAQGLGGFADQHAPGVLALLAPVRRRAGVVLELGCGAGGLTRHLVAAGHRVIATDASPAMLDLAAAAVPGAEFRRLMLPDDPLPAADAVISIGHVLSYLPDETAICRALQAAAAAVRPGGLLMLDLCTPQLGQVRRDGLPVGLVGADWAMITRPSTPRPERHVREVTTFIRTGGDRWRRDDERHEIVLQERAVPVAVLTGCGLSVTVDTSFGGAATGAAELPTGMISLVGHRPPVADQGADRTG